MIVPLISSLIAVIISLFSWLIYMDKVSFLGKLSAITKGNKKICLALNLIAFALLLGLVGYFLKLGVILRSIRLFIMIIAIVFIKISLAENLDKLPKLNPIITNLINFSGVKSLQILSGILILFLGLKTIVAVDWPNGDTWMYHLPFAARFWGLVSPQEYLFEAEREPFYNTTTMLPNILQGFFWVLFGLNRPQGANLVSFLSLMGYFVFLKYYLKIPYYLSVLAILAVPLIHIASTSVYVDLFTNLGFSLTLILTYLLCIKEDFITPKNIVIFILGGFIAANSKYLLVPPLFLVILFVFGRILWLILNRFSIHNRIKNIVSLILLTFGSSLIMFATEVRNIIVHQNPFYPLKISLFGYVLNHTVVPSTDYMSDKIKAMSPIQRWVFSLLEIGAFDERRPWPWTIAMDYVPLEADTFGMGGYFAVYVVFNVILFAYLCRQNTPETRMALILVILLSILTPFLPFAYQLRYYMYWIIFLISLNLYLLINYYSLSKNKWFKPTNYGYVSLMVVIIFAILTRWDYTYPNQMSLQQFMNGRVDEKVMNQIKDGDEVCLVGFTPLTFLYNSAFHEGRNYSVKAEFRLSDEKVKEKCGDRTIIIKQ